MASAPIVHFPGLNGVRFCAAFAVILAHVEGFKRKAGIANLIDWRPTHHVFDQLGTQGVKVFFVLSGFLITYLLLREEAVTGEVSVRRFYLRRILRIWPLYFLIVALGFFVLPHLLDPWYFAVKTAPHFALKLGLTVFLLPNLVFLVFGHIFAVGVLWSIGAEEQFYLAWPHVVRRRGRDLQRAILWILGALVAVKLVCYLLYRLPLPRAPQVKWLAWLIPEMLPFDCMAIGGLFALLYHRRSPLLLRLADNRALGAALAFAAVHLVCDLDFLVPPIENLVLGTVYGVVIINVATNERSFLQLRHPAVDSLGQVSYGIYMYHSIAVAVALGAAAVFDPRRSPWVFNAALYTLALALTFLLAGVSYRYFERPLLRFKDRFAVVRSAP